MAKDKKSFLLYTDVCHTVKHLSNEQAGELFKHLLAYVNDENPDTDNALVKIAFEPIKQSLKRDLAKYEKIRESRSKAGKKSAEIRKSRTKPTSVKDVEQPSTNPTVSDNVSVSDSDSVNVSDIKEDTPSFMKEPGDGFDEKESFDLEKSPVLELLTKPASDKLRQDFPKLKNLDQLLESAAMTIENEAKWFGQDSGWLYRRFKKWLNSYSNNPKNQREKKFDGTRVDTGSAERYKREISL